MDIDLTWLQETGLDLQTGMDYTGGKEKYLSALQRYCKNYEKNRTNVETFYSKQDFENYQITVHALKSNSRMIGASKLGDLFEELEIAAKTEDAETISEKTRPALQEYGNLIQALSPVREMEKVTVAGELSVEEAKEVCRKLLAALDDFDDELSKEMAEKLYGYPFRPTQKNRLKQAIEQIDDFLYDDAAEIIKDLSDGLMKGSL